MFEPLYKLIAKIKALDEEKILDKVYKEPKVLHFVETSNKNEQLYQGIDAKGVRLDSKGGSYSPFTILLKQRKGQPTNRVTLKDTGAFYRSIKAVGVGQYLLH